ncbi:MAG: GntR family transcriptional regulator [Alphaproteobacteria bacterium]|nr:GntR family transcriptional regulator [Alphaproteobacteria bacterium]MDE2013872.1 GntR family transcriptional regulator [Alphaproteobacteria bacterium]MDE2074159.1 GntR family transcriptional regulator [Alphaproteobacteria bacterium]MDE2352855.1 GntR family transcriptional regulator [Alphaproteobacteria bacterium]
MPAKLQTLKRPELLGDRVYATLRDYLRAGRFPVGQPLQEAALAAQLGVSRTPVREALTRLASDGLVVSEGRSFVLPDLAVGDIEDIYALRFLLEPEALRLVAAGKPDDKQLAPLHKALADMAAAHKKNDNEAFMEANYRYRNGWTSLVPNRRLVRAIQLYADHVRYLRVFTLDDASVREIVLDGLNDLTAALSAGDGAAAAKAMRAHLENAKRILLNRTEQAQ